MITLMRLWQLGFKAYFVWMFLMVSCYALKDKEVIQACQRAGCGENTMEEPWELYNAMDKLPQLYELAKEAYKAVQAKLVLISLSGSQMVCVIDKVKDYQVDLELCPATYERNGDLR